jgi:hypothetical protein
MRRAFASPMAFAICRGSARSSAPAGTPLRGFALPSTRSTPSRTTTPAAAISPPASLPRPIASGSPLSRSHLHPRHKHRKLLSIWQLDSSNSISPQKGHRPTSIRAGICVPEDSPRLRHRLWKRILHRIEKQDQKQNGLQNPAKEKKGGESKQLERREQWNE